MWRWRLMSSHFQVGHGCVRTVLKSTYGKAVVKTKPTRAVLCYEGEAAPVYMEKSNALQWSLPPSHNRVTTSCSMAIKTPGPLVWELRVFFFFREQSLPRSPQEELPPFVYSVHPQHDFTHPRVLLQISSLPVLSLLRSPWSQSSKHPGPWWVLPGNSRR